MVERLLRIAAAFAGIALSAWAFGVGVGASLAIGAPAAVGILVAMPPIQMADD